MEDEFGLVVVRQFSPQSFDRILLDPPCSALGLRPKLQLAKTSLKSLQGCARFQKRFVSNAIALLKPGGIMTYSTCTIHNLENEGMVRHILDDFRGSMELLPITFPLGSPGLPGCGLNEQERHCVKRFDPTSDLDTMGFFVAKFRKVR